MIIYTIIIGIAVIIVFLLSIFYGIPTYDYSLLYVFLMTLISTALVILIDGLVALFVNKLPKKWFNFRYKRFKIFKWERKFYEFLKIKKWKDHTPELGKLANFRKNKVLNPNDNKYIERFLEECCVGEIVHLVSIFLGYLIILLKPEYWLLFGVPVATTSAILNYLSYMILRYNRPKLLTLHKRNERLNRGVKNE